MYRSHGSCIQYLRQLFAGQAPFDSPIKSTIKRACLIRRAYWATRELKLNTTLLASIVALQLRRTPPFQSIHACIAPVHDTCRVRLCALYTVCFLRNKVERLTQAPRAPDWIIPDSSDCAVAPYPYHWLVGTRRTRPTSCYVISLAVTETPSFARN